MAIGRWWKITSESGDLLWIGMIWIMPPIDGKGGIGKMVQLFGGEMEPIIDEMNEALAA